jgi:selenoprotein W-related protein
LAEKILSKHKNAITSLELRPSTGGVFEVSVNGTLVFSKRQLGRFPNEGEAESLVEAKLGAGR